MTDCTHPDTVVISGRLVCTRCALHLQVVQPPRQERPPRRVRQAGLGETQDQLVLRHLLAGWTCGTILLGLHVPRYSASIHRLKAEHPELELERRRCHQEHGQPHPRSVQYEWRMTPRGQGRLDLDTPEDRATRAVEPPWGRVDVRATELGGTELVHHNREER